MLLWIWTESWPCMLQTRPAAINQYCLPVGPTAAKSLHTAAGGKWDRQTPYRYTDTAAYHVSSVNKQHLDPLSLEEGGDNHTLWQHIINMATL